MNPFKNDSPAIEVLADEGIWDKQTVARHFKVSPKTIERWVNKGLLKSLKLAGLKRQNRVYFRIEDVKALLMEQ